MIGIPSGCKEARQFAVMRESAARRLRALTVAAMLGSALQPLSAHAGGPEDQAITLSIANESREPLRCIILFAHFVVTDVGPILPSADLSITMFRQDGDGALWIPRADGRDMHYGSRCRLDGTVVCGNARAAP